MPADGEEKLQAHGDFGFGALQIEHMLVGFALRCVRGMVRPGSLVTSVMFTPQCNGAETPYPIT
eukprot:3282349-Amphidinium_carterae.1